MEHPTLRMFHKWIGYILFPRDDIRKVRIGDLQLLFAAVNKRVVSPVTLLVSHWLNTPNLQGPVGCTSLVTRLATNLNLLENSSLNFLDELRIYYGYDSFRHARMLKRENNIMYMLYDSGKVRLPNPGLGLYVVQNYLIDIAAEPVSQRVPQRVASERMATHQERTWHGADPGPEEPVHVHYRDYNPRVLRDPWAQYTHPEEPAHEETWQEGQDHQWTNRPFQAGRYSTDPFGASGSGTQPPFDAGRTSDASYAFTRDYYHEAGAFFARTDNNLLAIRETQARHGQLLEQQQKWNQDHAAAMQEMRQENATISDNVTSLLHYFQIE